MTTILHGTTRIVAAGVAALAARFRGSLPVRIAEQRARIERTGLAGMI